MTDSIHQLVEAITARTATRQRAAGRLMSRLQDDPALLPALLGELHDRPEPDLILGITGAPGSGKSTLTDAMITEIRSRDPRIAIGVMAVDPASTNSGGAFLGDRLRMMRHATDENVFIRSLSTRGHLGGLTLGVQGILAVMRLLGCRVVFIETVGIGQNELDIARVADLTAIVLSPGQGDGVQLMKSGLMEIGDIYIVNKSDRDGADIVHRDLLSFLRMKEVHELDAAHSSFSFDPHEPVGPGLHVQKVSAKSHEGIPELIRILDEITQANHERWKTRRAEGLEHEIRTLILEEMKRRCSVTLEQADEIESPGRRVLQGECTVQEAAQDLIRNMIHADPLTTPRDRAED